MAGSVEGAEKSLEQTPTWVVAVVCTVFIIASLLVERGIHRLGKYFKRAQRKELFHTLEQIKNELMLLGFISLLLTVFQNKVASICMPESLSHQMLPCPYQPSSGEAPVAARRRLFATEATTTTGCKAGYVPLISVEGLHQLHIFIFILAVVHVCYSCLTVLLGLWQVHNWKKWEVQAHSEGGLALNTALKPNHHGRHEHLVKAHGINFAESRVKYRFLHQSITGLNLDSYIYSFFRQFGKPIYRTDYFCLRMGFITKHNLSPDYDFHHYIRRAMEEDFKRVVGISALLWAIVCIFLLTDLDGWYTYFWIAFIPTILVLIVGAKLQHIILSLAIEVRGGVDKITLSDPDQLDDGFKKAEKPNVAALVEPTKPRDDLFWFKRPHILVKLIHLILFQNAFELAFFFWAMFTYGFDSCLVGKTWMISVRLGMGVFVLILCSVSTLPLYALVSQMGSSIKFPPTVQEGINNGRTEGYKTYKGNQEHDGRARQSPEILGDSREVGREDRAVNIELPVYGGANNTHEHQYPRPDQGGSNATEIDEASMSIPPKSASPRNNPASPLKSGSRKLSLANVFTLAAATEKQKMSGSEQLDDIP